MIMFNKHLTQIEPQRLPEGVDSKVLTPREIVDYHLNDAKKIYVPSKAEVTNNLVEANNEASQDQMDKSIESLVEELDSAKKEERRTVKNYHNNVVVIE